VVKHRYAKGANAERELSRILKGYGFGVIRSARSGGSISIPDIVGIKNGIVLAFECKTWERKPSLRKDEFDEFLDWCKRTSSHGYLAWRKRAKWLFLNIKELENKDILKDGVDLEKLLNEFNLL